MGLEVAEGRTLDSYVENMDSETMGWTAENIKSFLDEFDPETRKVRAAEIAKFLAIGEANSKETFFAPSFDSEFRRKKSAEVAHYLALGEAKTKGTLFAPKEDIPKSLQKYRMMGASDYNTYIRKCKESDGFDVSGCSGRLPGGISACTKKSKTSVKAARFAVKRQNEKKNRSIKYLGLVRANVQGVAGVLYYLTLKAIDDIDGKEKNFRATVWIHVSGKFSLEGFKKEPRQKQPTLKRPFNIFVGELRESFEFANKKYGDVLRIASAKWRVMSSEDKEVYKNKCLF